MSRRTFCIGLIGPLIIIAFLTGRFLLPRKPVRAPVSQGQLRPCPKSPNCVCTQGLGSSSQMEPLSFTGSHSAAKQRLLAAIATIPRLRVVEESDDYLRAEATSRLLRFVDDVEFLIDSESGKIHYRSASRTGHWDMGANRARMERIRQAFESAAE